MGIKPPTSGSCASTAAHGLQELLTTLGLISAGRWSVPHSLALFENSDVLCVANREGQEVSCMRAGLDSSPHFGGRDVTGSQVTNYKNLGRVYAIAEKGTFTCILTYLQSDQVFVAKKAPKFLLNSFIYLKGYAPKAPPLNKNYAQKMPNSK